jgi:hypothetical protein
MTKLTADVRDDGQDWRWVKFSALVVARALIIFGSVPVLLTIASTEWAFAASNGCNAINALPAQHLAPSGAYGMGLPGETWSTGDAITLAGTPSANVSGYPSLIYNYTDNRFANAVGGRATFVILTSETSAWLGWQMWANSNPGGLTVTISCKSASSSASKGCPPNTHRGTLNGKVTCVCDKAGAGVCN